MKPNQQQYEKYFRRPLAWLLSFGMIASYVPATHALEGESGEKEARTYYDDTPVGVTASTAMIPMAESEATVVEAVVDPTPDPDATPISLADAIDKAIEDAPVDENNDSTFDGTLPAGNYELTDDLDLNEYGYNLKFVGAENALAEVTLDLNGHTLTGATTLAEGNDYGSVIYLEYADLTLISTETPDVQTYESQDTSTETKGTITGGTGSVQNPTTAHLPYHTYGGGIFAYQSTLNIDHVMIEDNSAANGGGIYAIGSELVLTNCDLSTNTASSYGGGISLERTTFALDYVTISDNGGDDCFGGGLYALTESDGVLTSCTITKNTASEGGAIFNAGSHVEIADQCTIEHNASLLNNNGVYLQVPTEMSSSIELAGSLVITDNVYLEEGAVIILSDGFFGDENNPTPVKMEVNGVFTSESETGANKENNAHAYFTSVDTDAYVLYDENGVELKIGGFEDSDYDADEKETSLPVSTKGNSITDLFTSLVELQAQIQTAYKLDDEEVTVKYYKKAEDTNPVQRTTLEDWEEITDGDDTAAEQAQEILATAGGEIKVEYSIPDDVDGTTTVATFVIESADLYTLTSVDTENGSFTLTNDESNAITKAEENDTVTITATPDEGYELSDITVTYTVGGEETTLKLPSTDDDTDVQPASEDDESTLTENVDGTYSFTMPAANVSIAVTFTEVETETPIDPVIKFTDDFADLEGTTIEVTSEKVSEGLSFPTYKVTDGEESEDALTEGYTVKITYGENSTELTDTTNLSAIQDLLKDEGDTVTVTITVTATDDEGQSTNISFTWKVVAEEEEVTYPHFSLTDGENKIKNGDEIEVAESEIEDLEFPTVAIMVEDGDVEEYAFTVTATCNDGEDDVQLDIYDDDGDLDLTKVKDYLEEKFGNEVTVTLTMVDGEGGNVQDANNNDVTFSFTWVSVEDEEDAIPTISITGVKEAGTVIVKESFISSLALPSYTVVDQNGDSIDSGDYTLTMEYLDEDGDSKSFTVDNLSDIKEILTELGSKVTVTMTVTMIGTYKTSSTTFIWWSVDDNYVPTPYEVKINVGEHGNVWLHGIEYRSETSSTTDVYENDDARFIIFPSNGYEVESITITKEGVAEVIDPMYYETLTGADLTYTIFTVENVTEEFQIDVKFNKAPENYITLNYNITDSNNNPVTSTLAIGADGYLTEELSTSISRAGYTFEGWYRDSVFTESALIDTENISTEFFANKAEIFAKWAVIPYTITFDPDGGTIPTLESDQQTTLTTSTDESTKWTITQTFLDSVTPTKEHSTFAGWSLGGGTILNSSYQFSADTTVIALWTTKYPIQLNANGGTVTNVVYTESNGTIATLPKPVREGYTFDGWYTGSDGSDGVTGVKVIENSTVFTSASTIYAKWIATLYKAELDYGFDDKEGQVTSLTVGHQGEISPDTPLPTAPTRPGYSFDAWYTDSDISNEFDYEPFSLAGFDIGDTVATLYAGWILQYFEVTFHPNYLGTNDEYVTPYYVKTTNDTHLLVDIEDDEAKPKRAGYDFVDWYDNADLEGTPIDLTTTPFYADTELFAKWEERLDTINLDPVGGTVANNITKVNINADTGLIANFAEFEAIPIPLRTGYTFIDWVNEANEPVTATMEFKPDDTIYALWEADEFQLSFHLNGGIVDDDTVDTTVMEPITVTYDQPIGTLVGGKKLGATFAGWHLVDENGDLATDETDNYIILDAETIWNYTKDQRVIAKYNFEVTATVEGEGGVVTAGDHTFTDEDKTIYVFEGDGTVFNFKVEPGYRIASITIDGDTSDRDDLATDTNYVNNTSYTLSDVQQAATFVFEFEQVPIYEIQITGDNGTYTTTSNEDTENNIVFGTEGDDVSITFTADRGYYIASATANGANMNLSSQSLYPTEYTYSVTDIMNDVDLVVVFQELPRYVITATSGDNGSIDATNKYLGGLVNDTMEIYQGEDEIFEFFPDVGWEVDTVTISDSEDSWEVTATTSYTITQVMEHTKIHVTFKEIVEDQEDIVITLNANGGSLVGVSNMKPQEDGTLASMPTDPTYPGYIFNGWWNADNGGTQISTNTVFIQDTTIYAQWVEDLTGVYYTVSFESNGGTTISNLLVSANSTLTTPTEPTRSGYTFAGWYTTSLFTTPWDFTEDIVSKDMTLYAKWTANSTDTNTSVSRVVDHNGNPVVGATVSLVRNGTTYYSATTDSDGYYAFNLLAAGSYNLVVSTLDGYEKTTEVTIYNSSTTLPLVKLPELNISSSATIATGSLTQVVGGLDTLANLIAAKTSNFSKVLVDIAISSYTSTSSQSTITNGKQAQDVIASFFDVDLTKTVTTTTGLTYSEAITDADSLVEIVLSIPTVYQGKDNYSIYRIHNGSVDRITSTYNSNSERVVLSSDGTKLSLFVKKFSAFALAYSDSESTSSTKEHDVKVTSYLNGVESSSTSIGSVAVSSSTAAVGDVVTVTPYPNFGFSLDNVVVKTDAGKYLTVTTNSNGTYSFAQTSSNATVYVYFTTTLNAPDGSLSDSNTPTAPQISYFSDVNVTDTFCSAINEVVSLGLMSGTGNGTFSPHDSITRGMIVSILQYMSGESTTLTPGFSDVYPTDYYYYAVAWGESSGVISGYEDNTYQPNKAITREELAAILYRYSQKYGNYDVLWYFPLSFSDTESVTFWAKDAVTWCVNRDVLSARYNNFFLPQAVSTRAEVAVAVVALLNSQS